MKSIIRNYLAKLAAGRTDDGIMITLPDPKKINFQEAMIQDLLMRNGVDPNAITSEEMLKSILNQIDMASKQTAPCLLYTSPSPRDGLLSRMPSSA